jgi:hypothetical protein
MTIKGFIEFQKELDKRPVHVRADSIVHVESITFGHGEDEKEHARIWTTTHAPVDVTSTVQGVLQQIETSRALA